MIKLASYTISSQNRIRTDIALIAVSTTERIKDSNPTLPIMLSDYIKKPTYRSQLFHAFLWAHFPFVTIRDYVTILTCS